MKKVVLLGAGPAALAAGYELARNNFAVTLIEREGQVGGISKTIKSKCYRFDVGGHRFFTKSREVNNLWKEILGRDFIKTPRLSRIYYNRKFFKYPIEIKDTLKNAGFGTSILCLLSYAKSKVFPKKPEKSFADWVSNRFGRKLFMMFFKSYTEKVWGISTEELSAEWAAQRIKGLSISEVIKNAIFKPKVKAKSLIDEFYYPKYGPGMMYEAMAKKITGLGGEIILNHNVVALIIKDKKIIAVKISDKNSKISTIKGDEFISTIPLPDTCGFLASERINLTKQLKFRDFLSVNLVVKKKNIFPDTWIYVHDPTVRLGRIQNFKNWSKFMTANPNYSPIGCEYFCNQGDEIWNTPDIELIKLATTEISQIGFSRPDQVLFGNVYRMRDAYPVYMGSYHQAIEKAKRTLAKFKNLQVAGRGGMFRYNNMDHSILSGIYAARNIMGEKHDLWSINADEEYHENKK